MKKIIIPYALVLAAAALLLEWLEFQHLTRLYSTELYIILIAAGFASLGLWAGHRATRKGPADLFKINSRALETLGVTGREYEVLKLLSEGQSNKEIARSLRISPNTIKSHVARLFQKLEVERRTQAIRKARALHLIP